MGVNPFWEVSIDEVDYGSMEVWNSSLIFKYDDEYHEVFDSLCAANVEPSLETFLSSGDVVLLVVSSPMAPSWPELIESQTWVLSPSFVRSLAPSWLEFVESQTWFFLLHLLDPNYQA